MKLCIETHITNGGILTEEQCKQAIHEMYMLVESSPKLRMYDITFSWAQNGNLCPRLVLEHRHTPGKLRRITINFSPDEKSATGKIVVHESFVEITESKERIVEISGAGDNVHESAINALDSFLNPQG
jgi:hypothetical protein